MGYLVGLTYAAKQEAKGRGGAAWAAWPLLFVLAPALYAAPAAVAEPTGAVLLAGFLTWVTYAVVLLRRGGPHIGGAVVALIAGISLLDALLVASAGEPFLAWGAALGFPVTLFLQRYIRGS